MNVDRKKAAASVTRVVRTALENLTSKTASVVREMRHVRSTERSRLNNLTSKTASVIREMRHVREGEKTKNRQIHHAPIMSYLRMLVMKRLTTTSNF